MFITVPILKASLLKEASSALHITTRFAFENDSDDSLGDAKPNHFRQFTKFRLSSKTQIDIMKAKASLRGVSTPLIEVANFLWYRIFSRIIKSCFH